MVGKMLFRYLKNVAGTRLEMNYLSLKAPAVL
jgi:hypothetical protein